MYFLRRINIPKTDLKTLVGGLVLYRFWSKLTGKITREATVALEASLLYNEQSPTQVSLRINQGVAELHLSFEVKINSDSRPWIWKIG